ncbi:vitamin K epoxide reductase complex subunit 1 [Athalia rosae]|uniref:vitamin K epoxide reductase complex subunit 1 n=1 Tax=Athalia rosae TaxID=37344 RepID=UPI0020349E57|nr:vitamin K epoxide reductase complex subunit 1 [Athalia rosae]
MLCALFCLIFEREVSMSLNSVQKANASIISSCIVGLVLSYYAYIVETSKELDHSYEAMCDISEHISCTKAFMSEYGKGFGLIPKTSIFYMPNSVYGLVFYSCMAVMSVSNTYFATIVLIIFGILSNLGSIYLGYILYMLKDICVLCIGTYLVNCVNLILAIRKFGIISRLGASKKEKLK